MMSEYDNEEEINDLEISTDDENLEDVESFELSDKYIDEVVQLTEYDGNLTPKQSGLVAIAEYKNIDLKLIDQKLATKTKNFVNRITKFVLEFNDEVITPQHESYLKQVAELQYNNLLDLLYLQEINKQMINNIVERINSTSAEDYAILQSYTNLVTQHLKLMKEVQTQYRNIPTVLKKMRADVLCNQQIEAPLTPSSEVYSQSFGDLQFNNHKQMLKSILTESESKEKEKE